MKTIGNRWRCERPPKGPERVSTRRFSERNYDCLRALRTCLLQKGGWEWRGARGWLFSTEFPYQLAGLATGFLSSLADNHLVDREDVRDPFVRRPSNIYRITQLGIDLLAEHEREQRTAPRLEPEPGVIVFSTINAVEPESGEPEPIIVPGLTESPSEVERDTIFIARHQWNGLAFLQTQPAEAWFALGDFRDAIGRFHPNDAYLLVDKALLNMSKSDAGERKYRATTIGRGARLRDGETNERAAMVHVPGIRAAATSARANPVAQQPRERPSGPVSGG